MYGDLWRTVFGVWPVVFAAGPWCLGFLGNQLVHCSVRPDGRRWPCTEDMR